MCMAGVMMERACACPACRRLAPLACHQARWGAKRISLHYRCISLHYRYRSVLCTCLCLAPLTHELTGIVSLLCVPHHLPCSNARLLPTCSRHTSLRISDFPW